MRVRGIEEREKERERERDREQRESERERKERERKSEGERGDKRAYHLKPHLPGHPWPAGCVHIQ